MATKYVRFNYYEVVLVPAALLAMQEAGGEDTDIDPFAGAVAYDMTGLLDYISSGNMKELHVHVSEEIAEMEIDTLANSRDYIRSFQLSKLKDTNIPAKKRIGEIREEIKLRDDEYIGEFTSVLYDTQLHTLMVQSNKYGLTTKEIEKYLTEIRWRYLSAIDRDEDNPNEVKLRPIIDLHQADRVLDAKYFRKITVRGADLMEDALIPDGLMSKAVKTLAESSGVIFEISISVHRAGKKASLDRGFIEQIVSDFKNQPDHNKPKVEISKIDDDGMNVDVINLLEPRMSDRIKIEIEPRVSIGHEYLFQHMLPLYENRRPDLIRILRPRK